MRKSSGLLVSVQHINMASVCEFQSLTSCLAILLEQVNGNNFGALYVFCHTFNVFISHAYFVCFCVYLCTVAMTNK